MEFLLKSNLRDSHKCFLGIYCGLAIGKYRFRYRLNWNRHFGIGQIYASAVHYCGHLLKTTLPWNFDYLCINDLYLFRSGVLLGLVYLKLNWLRFRHRARIRRCRYTHSTLQILCFDLNDWQIKEKSTYLVLLTYIFLPYVEWHFLLKIQKKRLMSISYWISYFCLTNLRIRLLR